MLNIKNADLENDNNVLQKRNQQYKRLLVQKQKIKVADPKANLKHVEDLSDMKEGTANAIDENDYIECIKRLQMARGNLCF